MTEIGFTRFDLVQHAGRDAVPCQAF